MVAVLGYFFLPSWLLLSTRIIITWNIGVLVFLSLALIMMNAATPGMMRKTSQRLDENRWTILILLVAAACVSLLSIAFLLKSDKKTLTEWKITLHVTLSVVTIVFSWLLVHTTFALHYAHLYYGNMRGRNTHEQAKGLDFPSEEEPDYWDFMYFSLIIGMTCQVSDVQVASSSMRRLALAHGVITFFFNTVILALSINIIAGLI